MMETKMLPHYLEDLAPGQRFQYGPISVNAEKIKASAAEFDPQPFHLNDELARDTLFRGLAACGWHTAALTMRFFVGSANVLGKSTQVAFYKQIPNITGLTVDFLPKT